MKRWVLLVTIVILALIGAENARAEMELNGKYVTWKDNKGRVITRTAHQVSIGDEYLNSDNEL